MSSPRLCFLSSTPMNIFQGSGTFSSISVLARALVHLGCAVDVVTPKHLFPIYTLQRFFFNRTLHSRIASDYDVTIGFDLDGYTLSQPKRCRHVASIKGVIADEMRFESGITRATMAFQARWEKTHVERADSVITTSQYAAERIQQLYRVPNRPAIVPELIDLGSWQRKLDTASAGPDRGKFVVLCVCRFYPRKRLEILLGAAERLRSKIPELEVRIAGGGPELGRLKTIWRKKNLEGVVKWRPNLKQEELAAEYKMCTIFCLPSVQEGFGIVFLEAMASGKPIVAARAAAVPEVVRHGVLVEPESIASLADGIYSLYSNSGLRESLAAKGRELVRQFDSPIVARRFLSCLGLEPPPSANNR
jgi:glycosyltransferase involved in cell wall biosynthesis